MKCFIMNRECKEDRPRQEDQNREDIFMISPFGFPFDDLYKHGIEQTVIKRMNKTIARADQSLQLGYVMCRRICRKILLASNVLVDLTIPNGNVYYEFGLGFGRGKEVILIKNKRSQNQYVKAFKSDGANIIQYEGLKDFKDGSAIQDGMGKPYSLSKKRYDDLRINSPDVILKDKPVILNIVNDECPASDLHSIAIERALEQYNDNKETQEQLPNDDDLKPLEDWEVITLSVSENFDVKKSLKQMMNAKICIFDMTHYREHTNAYIFFLMGLAHACEREVIPVINRPMNRSVPFDIRGLWQVNYDKVEELESELRQTIPIIDNDFKKERSDYLYKQIWNPFLIRKQLHVITCAREAAKDDDRKGQRTNIDKWDFTTVSELTFFIAQKYETAQVKIEEPKNKKGTKDLNEDESIEDFHNSIREELKDKDCVIIGSPDVSDYAEVVLSDIHGVAPHSPQQNSKNIPFLFIKQTKGRYHPRRKSSFYRIPKAEEKDKVKFGRDLKTSVGCVQYEKGTEDHKTFGGHTCVVITIADNPCCGEQPGKPPQIMILSGYTGVATYAGIKLLTDTEYREQLEKYITIHAKLASNEKRKIVGANILVSLDYLLPVEKIQSGDIKSLTNVEFEKVELIIKETNS